VPRAPPDDMDPRAINQQRPLFVAPSSGLANFRPGTLTEGVAVLVIQFTLGPAILWGQARRSTMQLCFASSSFSHSISRDTLDALCRNVSFLPVPWRDQRGAASSAQRTTSDVPTKSQANVRTPCGAPFTRDDIGTALSVFRSLACRRKCRFWERKT